jgi:hypothetical protein
VCGRTDPKGIHQIVDCRCTNCNQEFHSYVFIREVTTRDESWKEYECRDCGKETTQDYVGGM